MRKRPEIKRKHKINEEIKSFEVRIVGDGEPKVIKTSLAIKIAQDQEKDLILIVYNFVLKYVFAALELLLLQQKLFPLNQLVFQLFLLNISLKFLLTFYFQDKQMEMQRYKNTKFFSYVLI